MTDTQLLTLYEQRDESAIARTAEHYGAYCKSIAMNILRNPEDAEECVNDALLNAWNAIPPYRPDVFTSFLGRIVRNLSLNRYKSRNAEKRGGAELPLMLSELEECIPASTNVAQQAESRDLTRIIADYLATIRYEDKMFFILRYWYSDPVADIAGRFGASVSRVNTNLHRTRKKLKVYLESRGITHEN